MRAENLPPLDLICFPTAGTLNKQQFRGRFFLYDEGGMTTYTLFGLIHRLTLGFSYGGDHLIGQKPVNWNQKVDFTIKYRFLDETYNRPAIAAGYESQGIGSYSEDRYLFKSTGFYCVVSKNFLLKGNLGVHGGINYSLEDEDDHDVNFYVGLDKEIGSIVYLALEYSPGLNDDDPAARAYRRGFLNSSLGFHLPGGFDLELVFLDLLENSKALSHPMRCIRIGLAAQL